MKRLILAALFALPLVCWSDPLVIRSHDKYPNRYLQVRCPDPDDHNTPPNDHDGDCDDSARGVPEPGSLGLYALALAGLATSARYRQSRSRS